MSKIEWTEKTWNPIVGCSIVSPGCTNCYAMRMAARLETMSIDRYAGLTKIVNDVPVWTGEVAIAPDATFLMPLNTKRPTTWFVNSMSDLFHEGISDAMIDRVFAVMALTPHHTYQVLTKRSKRMLEYMSSSSTCIRVLDAMFDVADLAAMMAAVNGARRPWESRPKKVAFVDDPDAHWPLFNVWHGVSAERQKEAEERVLDLLATPAAVRYVSGEPLLGPVDLTRIKSKDHPDGFVNALRFNERRLDWIIVGGESGYGSRPMHPDWARSIRDQCASYGVPFFFKQHGTWITAVDRDRDDPDWRLDYTRKYAHRGRHHWINLAGGIGFHGERFHVMRHVTKQQAGRDLDGRTWDEMPTQPAAKECA